MKKQEKKKEIKGKLPAKKKNLVRRFLILIPLALCLLWVISLIARQKLIYLPDIGFKFSPIKDNTPLIIGLVIFICGYLLFLSMLYFENLKSFFNSLKKKK